MLVLLVFHIVGIVSFVGFPFFWHHQNTIIHFLHCILIIQVWIMDNFDLRLRKWIRYELACRKIQRCFRQWCMHRMLYRRIKLNGMKRLNRSYDISDSKGKIDISKQSTDNFQAILKQTANFQSKCAFWMKVIDLKRMFPEKSADLLLRSLIESQGDINRAQI